MFWKIVIIGKRPRHDHFRQADIIISAPSEHRAEMIANDMLDTLYEAGAKNVYVAGVYRI